MFRAKSKQLPESLQNLLVFSSEDEEHSNNFKTEEYFSYGCQAVDFFK